MKGSMQEFRERWVRIHALGEIQQLLDWDQQVMMPAAGAPQRAQQIATVATIAHECMISEKFADLVEALADSADLDPEERADLREARRICTRARKVPASLVAERARACVLAQSAWETARSRNDFEIFKPHLEEVLRLTRATADAVGGAGRYDALIEEYEPGASAEVLETLFAELRQALVALLDRILGAPGAPGRVCLRRPFPVEIQKEVCLLIAGDMGYDFDAGRLDVSAHPFTTGTFRDVRITTRYQERNLPSALFGTMHEVGHALYEQGLDPDRFSMPSGQACSLGIHESQSRFWENMVGRSRPFWVHYFPILRDRFRGLLDDVEADGFYRSINNVNPSPIRVEADEVTYNLHIILRFELERDLLEERLSVADLPAAWNRKMEETVGIRPGNDAEGVLQDIHWSAGAIGYFPTYTLGNLYAAQFAESLRRDLHAFDSLLERGDLHPIRDWLREKIHRKGLLLRPGDLCESVTGSPLSARCAVDYLNSKYAEIYGF